MICPWLLHPGSRWMPNMLLAVKLDHSGELFLDTPSRLSAWVSVFWAWHMDLNKGVPTLFAYCEKLIRKFFFKFSQGTCPCMHFALIFLGLFFFFWGGWGGGSVGKIIYREYIVFRGWNIFCRLASTCTDRGGQQSFIIMDCILIGTDVNSKLY